MIRLKTAPSATAIEALNEDYADIITGAPIANIPFEEVRYWPEMLEIMEWTKTNEPLALPWNCDPTAAQRNLNVVKSKYPQDPPIKRRN